jgi:hypothetical protein
VEYSDVRAGVALSDALFDPLKWSTVPHWFSGPGEF